MLKWLQCWEALSLWQNQFHRFHPQKENWDRLKRLTSTSMLKWSSLNRMTWGQCSKRKWLVRRIKKWSRRRRHSASALQPMSRSRASQQWSSISCLKWCLHSIMVTKTALMIKRATRKSWVSLIRQTQLTRRLTHHTSAIRRPCL